MMGEIIAEEERAKRLAEFQAKLEAEKAAAAASTAAYQAKVAEEKAAAAVAAAETAAAVVAAETAAAAQAAAVAAAAPQISLSGSASVSYDDNGTAASATTYDADLTFTGSVGTVGGTNTTVTVGMDVNGANAAISGADMATTIGPVTIAADMFDEVSKATSSTVTGGQRTETTDTGVTISLDVPVGDMTIGLDNSGNVILSGTFSGVTVSHTVGDSTITTASAAIAGIDMSVTNTAGSTTWTLDTTVSGVDLTLTSAQKITAAFGLAGNTLTVTRVPAVAYHAGTVADNDWNTSSVASYSTAAISRDLTSGATLTATYSTKDDSLTLKAAVTF
jgi:hypothetical protein